MGEPALALVQNQELAVDVPDPGGEQVLSGPVAPAPPQCYRFTVSRQDPDLSV
jgi:hypothetical protein